MYDITAKSSFATLKNWVRELKSLGPENMILAIAGNKSDLESKREVPAETANAYAEEISATYLETSAKNATNVSEIFAEISRRLPKVSNAAEHRSGDILNDSLLREPKSKPLPCC